MSDVPEYGRISATEGYRHTSPTPEGRAALSGQRARLISKDPVAGKSRVEPAGDCFEVCQGHPEPVDVDAIRARAERADPAPWEYAPSTEEILAPDGGIAEMTWPGRNRTNAEFITHARTDVPALLDALAAARADLAALREAVEGVRVRYATQAAREMPNDYGMVPPRTSITAREVARDLRAALAAAPSETEEKP